MAPLITRLVSGGQTGVDRAALDCALDLGLPCGGWCPKGRLAEDGVIPARYPLKETASKRYPVRTEANVKDSDGTLILSPLPLSGGTALTRELAERHERPCLVLDLDAAPDADGFRAWVAKHGIATLNVAGPRESSRPGMATDAYGFLSALLDGSAGVSAGQA